MPQLKIIKMKLSNYDIECLQSAKQKIDEDLSLHHKIEELAHHVGMGSTRLKIAFKQHYGFSIYNYLLSERMNRAKVDLETTDKPLKVIAKEAGFVYRSNFNAAFKKKFGISPGVLRK
jgi:AraC-like DNA-binding protein